MTLYPLKNNQFIVQSILLKDIQDYPLDLIPLVQLILINLISQCFQEEALPHHLIRYYLDILQEPLPKVENVFQHLMAKFYQHCLNHIEAPNQESIEAIQKIIDCLVSIDLNIVHQLQESLDSLLEKYPLD